jgi:ribosomal protein S12 methylthiotransferase accessory factor
MKASEAEALLVSRRVGLVTRIEPQIRGPEEPVPPYLFTSMLAHFDFQAQPRSHRLNAGKGRTEEEARLAALGEAVERYSGYHWDPARVHCAPPDGNAIRPTDCVLHSDAQYAAGIGYARWDENADTAWIEGIELPGNTPVMLPAALVYLVGALPRPEDHVAAVTSNGLSAGTTLTQAILGGLYEIIERDALMICWMNRLPATLIEPPQASCQTASIIRHYARFGVDVRLFLLPTDQPAHVVMAVGEAPEGTAPARVVGLGCDLDPIRALDKAVFELCQGRPSEASRYRENNPADRLKRYEDVKDLDDHPGFHAVPGRGAEFDFLYASGARTQLAALALPKAETPEAKLAFLVDRLRAAGARVAFVEITTSDVAAAGFRVVRCIATGFQPIHFGFREARLGGRRLFDAPVHWGLRNTALNADELNPCPHPLA